MNCPFCKQELRQDQDGFYTCYTDNCGCMAFGGNGASGTESLWKALIYLYEEKDLSDVAVIKRTKELDDKNKKLDMLQEFVTKLYLNGNITDEQLHWLKRIFNKE